jgi:hypothetical protein
MAISGGLIATLQPKKRSAVVVASAPGDWKATMPGRITREEALAEHPCDSLFYEGCPNRDCAGRLRCQGTRGH